MPSINNLSRSGILFMLSFLTLSQSNGADRFAGYERVVRDTHHKSLVLRENALRETIAEDSYWIKGNWGNTIWCLAALYLNEKTDDANKRLLASANAYSAAMEAAATDKSFRPEKTSELSPWGYFAFTDYARILCMFNAKSKHFPGRLKPETEAAMKEALWWLVKSKSKVAEASLDHLLVHHGTENHDLTLRPNYYLVASVLKEDPAFKDRTYDDGKTAADHYAAYNTYFRAWPRQRAMIGLWFEMGSDTYMKYSWPSLFNLHDLSPDPLVRKHFGMLLDLAFIEEAQISIRGRRGGGRNRAGYAKNSFEGYKNLLYAPGDMKAFSSHSKVIETSAYQLPPEAILLRKGIVTAEKPFLIVNRVPGEMKPGKTYTSQDDTHNSYEADSALVNYAYRTPNYILGSTLQNPSLHMTEDGKAVPKYSGISRQNRWSGMLFNDPKIVATDDGGKKLHLSAVYPVIERSAKGRPQHPFWSFQHKNVLFLQRITPEKGGMGSYSTGRIDIRFYGEGLKKVEKEGWIFVSNGNAYLGVKFLDGGYTWDETQETAQPATYSAEEPTRYLFHSGDTSSHSTFDAFQTAVLAGSLTVEDDRVEYVPTKGGPSIECFSYVVKDYKTFKLPRVDGEELNLRPAATYNSPYINGKFGEDRVTVSVGPLKTVYDFGIAD